MSLAHWVVPAQNSAVDPAVILRLLQSIACGDDVAQAEAWVGPGGQFRLAVVC